MNDVVQVEDLRASTNGDYELSQPLPPGALGLFGPEVPIGSAAYAAADARAVAPAVVPPSDAIPGWRAAGSLWPAERYIVRIPKKWNGRLVVAGTPGVRSEFSSDLIWSDPLLERGYAYASGNKSLGEGQVVVGGESRLEVDGAVMPRWFIPGNLGVSFWQHAPGNRFSRWMDEFFAITERARELLKHVHHREPEATYAVGLSNGGGQVRYALERSDMYSGGLAWNAVLWSGKHNLLRHLPQAIGAMNDGQPERLEDLGFPPDVHGTSGGSLYERNLATYWPVVTWLHAMLLDPETSIAFGDVTDPALAEKWNDKIATWRLGRNLRIQGRIATYAHTGNISAKMIDLAAEFDHLVPPKMHFYPYADMVSHAGKADMYRAELLEGAQHVESWSEDPNYPSLRPGYPRVLAAFDELVKWVEG